MHPINIYESPTCPMGSGLPGHHGYLQGVPRVGSGPEINTMQCVSAPQRAAIRFSWNGKVPASCPEGDIRSYPKEDGKLSRLKGTQGSPSGGKCQCNGVDLIQPPGWGSHSLGEAVSCRGTEDGYHQGLGVAVLLTVWREVRLGPGPPLSWPWSREGWLTAGSDNHRPLQPLGFPGLQSSRHSLGWPTFHPDG